MTTDAYAGSAPDRDNPERMTYGGVVEHPDGLRVTVRLSCPTSRVDHGELLELAGMGAATVSGMVKRNEEAAARFRAQIAAEEAKPVEPLLRGAVVEAVAAYAGRHCHGLLTRVAGDAPLPTTTRPWVCEHGDRWTWSELEQVEVRAWGFNPNEVPF